MNTNNQEHTIRYYLVQGQGWNRAYIYSAIAKYPVGTFVLMPALDHVGYGWDTTVKGEIVAEITEEEAYQMLPGVVKIPKSLICTITKAQYNDAEFYMTSGQMRKKMNSDIAEYR